MTQDIAIPRFQPPDPEPPGPDEEQYEPLDVTYQRLKHDKEKKEKGKK